MNEVKAVAQTMMQALADLKQRAAASTATFQQEVKNSHANFDKVDAVTLELKNANLAVEQMLSGTNSNFQTPPALADSNGVIINKGT